MLPLSEREATVSAKSSTYKIIRPRGILKCSGATQRRKRSGEIGEPWGAPTLRGAGIPGAPWKIRVHLED